MNAAKECRSCRSRKNQKMLQNEYLDTKICVDTAENELLEVLFTIIQYYSFMSLLATRWHGRTGPALPPVLLLSTPGMAGMMHCFFFFQRLHRCQHGKNCAWASWFLFKPSQSERVDRRTLRSASGALRRSCEPSKRCAAATYFWT